jgi:ketosteroid isomerase-like protein
VPGRNAEILMRGFELAPDDPEAFYAIFDLDVEWDGSHTGLPEFTTPRRGVDGVREFFHRWLGSFGAYEYDAEEVIERGDDVVVVLHHRGVGRHSGVEVEMTFAQVWSFRDGKVIRYRGFETKEEALAAIDDQR